MQTLVHSDVWDELAELPEAATELPDAVSSAQASFAASEPPASASNGMVPLVSSDTPAVVTATAAADIEARNNGHKRDRSAASLASRDLAQALHAADSMISDFGSLELSQLIKDCAPGDSDLQLNSLSDSMRLNQALASASNDPAFASVVNADHSALTNDEVLAMMRDPVGCGGTAPTCCSAADTSSSQPSPPQFSQPWLPQGLVRLEQLEHNSQPLRPSAKSLQSPSAGAALNGTGGMSSTKPSTGSRNLSAASSSQGIHACNSSSDRDDRALAVKRWEEIVRSIDELCGSNRVGLAELTVFFERVGPKFAQLGPVGALAQQRLAVMLSEVKYIEGSSPASCDELTEIALQAMTAVKRFAMGALQARTKGERRPSATEFATQPMPAKPTTHAPRPTATPYVSNYAASQPSTRPDCSASCVFPAPQCGLPVSYIPAHSRPTTLTAPSFMAPLFDDGDAGEGIKVHACRNCQRAKTACSNTRPCERCKRLGIPCDDVLRVVKRACSNCKRAKVKCNLEEGMPCGRCTRLGLVCVPHTPSGGERRSRKKRAKQPAAIAGISSGISSGTSSSATPIDPLRGLFEQPNIAEVAGIRDETHRGFGTAQPWSACHSLTSSSAAPQSRPQPRPQSSSSLGLSGGLSGGIFGGTSNISETRSNYFENGNLNSSPLSSLNGGNSGPLSSGSKLFPPERFPSCRH